MKITPKFKKGQIVINKITGQLLIIKGISEIKFLNSNSSESPTLIEYQCFRAGENKDNSYVAQNHIVLLKDALSQLKEAL